MSKTIFVLVTTLVLFLSCNTSADSPKNKKQKPEKKPSKEIFQGTHIIDIKCEGKFVPLRNRILTKQELIDAQKGDEAAKKIEFSTVITKLYNGQHIRLIKEIEAGFYFVEIETLDSKNDRIRGYIVSNYCGKSILKKQDRIAIQKHAKSRESESTLDFIQLYNKVNFELKDVVYAYIKPEADFIQYFTFSLVNDSKINYAITVIELQERRVSFSGIANLDKRYISAKQEAYLLFDIQNFAGHLFEIHIREDGTSAFFKFKNKVQRDSELVPAGIDDETITSSSEKAIMTRIK